MQFYPIEHHSWVAIDIHHNLGEQATLLTHKAGSSNKVGLTNKAASTHKSGSMSCRQLLKKLQQALNVTGELMDTNFPYHFITADGYTWYVSFSHSRQHAALLISPIPISALMSKTPQLVIRLLRAFFHPMNTNG